MSQKKLVKSLLKTFGKRRALLTEGGIGKYSRNIYNVETSPVAIVFPKNVSELKKLLKIAIKFKTPLYPLSTGKSWGLGSNLSVAPKHIVVDLSRMNKILNFDGTLGSIRIEPGVTQNQIYEFLKNSKAKFRLNVTGSTKFSSLIGNALERGVGHYGCRVSEVIGLEVLLGNETHLATGGFVNLRSKARMLYPHGIGADLTGLFFQSAFGIVTSATFRLQPIPELTTVVTIKPYEDLGLAGLVDLLIQAKFKGCLPENLHLSNKNRRFSVLAPLLARERKSTILEAKEAIESQLKEEWVATASINASSEATDILYARLRAEVAGRAIVSRDTCDERTDLSGTNDLERATREVKLNPSGVPSDDSVLSLGFGQNELLANGPVDSNTGALFVVPLLPCNGMDVDHAVQIVEKEFKSCGFKPYITLNLIESSCFEAVVNLTFERDNARQKKSALQVVRRTFLKLEREGFSPQRMSIFQMTVPQSISASHQTTLLQLKNLFDPHNIISRGRYELRGAQ